MKRFPIIAAVLSATTTFACADTTTTSAPGSAPAATAPIALSGPNQAAVNFLQATQKGDVADILATISVEAADKPLIEPILKLYAASAQLQITLEKKYGPAELARSKVPNLVPSPAAIIEAQTAAPKIDGDKATLTVRTTVGSPQEMAFKKVAGTWKLDAATTMKLLTPADRAATEKAAPRIAAATKAITDTRDEVETGAFGTVNGAIQKLQTRLLEVGKE